MSVPGFCLAEAANHWHLLERQQPPAAPAVAAAAPAGKASLTTAEPSGIEGWLAQWCALRERCAVAWDARMAPLWDFFHELDGALVEVVAAAGGRLGREGTSLQRAIARLLMLEPPAEPAEAGPA